MKVIQTIVLVTGILASGSSAFAAAQLTAADIKQELIGKKMNIKDKNGLRGTVTHSSNGKSKVAIPSRNFTDTGSWKLKGKNCASNGKMYVEARKPASHSPGQVTATLIPEAPCRGSSRKRHSSHRALLISLIPVAFHPLNGPSSHHQR